MIFSSLLIGANFVLRLLLFVAGGFLSIAMLFIVGTMIWAAQGKADA